jgi:hypothetical protein
LGALPDSAGIFDEFPQIAVRNTEIHAGGGTLRTGNSTKWADRIDTACS